MAQAREPAGISSTVMMLATTSTATAQPRASTWVAASHGSDGLSAPVAAKTQPPATAPSNTARRPRRSASARSPSAISPPRRTTLPASPCAPLPAPNSSPANAMVWVNSVLR
jgi:hypothetical protein